MSTSKSPSSSRRAPKKKGAKKPPISKIADAQPTAEAPKAKPTFYETLNELQHRQPKDMQWRGEQEHPRLVRLRPSAVRDWRIHFGDTGVEAYRMRERLGLSPSSDTHTDIVDGVMMISTLTADILEKLGMIKPLPDGSYETSKMPELHAKDAIHPMGCVIERRGAGEDCSTYYLQATDGDHLARVWARSLLLREAEMTEMAVSLLLTQANDALNCIKTVRDAIDTI